MRRALLVVPLLFACTAEQPWRVIVDEDATSVFLFVRAGGCDGEDVYTARARVDDGMPEAPDALAEGVYGVGGWAYDDSCARVGCGCVEVSAPFDEELVTELLGADCAPNEPTPECASPDAGMDAGGTDAGASDAGMDAGPAVDSGLVVPTICGVPEMDCLPPAVITGGLEECPSGTYRGDGCRPRMRPTWEGGSECPMHSDSSIRTATCGSLASLESQIADFDTAGGGVMLLPACVYVPAAAAEGITLNLVNPIVLEGAGASMTTLTAAATDCFSDCRPILNVNRTPGLVLRNLTITARAVEQTGLVLGTDTEHVVLSGVGINATGDGLSSIGTTDLVLRRPNISAERYGVLLDGRPETGGQVERVAILGGQISSKSRNTNAIALNLAGASQVEIAGLRISDYENGGSWLLMRGTDDVWIHHVSVVSSGTAVLADCMGPPCGMAELGTVVMHDNAISGSTAARLATTSLERSYWLTNTGGSLHLDTASQVRICNRESGTVSGTTANVSTIDCTAALPCTGNIDQR